MNLLEQALSLAPLAVPLALWSIVGWVVIARLSARHIERRWRSGAYDDYIARSVANAAPVVTQAVVVELEQRLPQVAAASAQAVADNMPTVIEAVGNAVAAELPAFVEQAGAHLRDSLQGTLGGIASGAARRDKAALQAEAEAMLAAADPALIELAKSLAPDLYKRAAKNPAVAEAVLRRFAPQLEQMNNLVRVVGTAKNGGGGAPLW